MKEIKRYTMKDSYHEIQRFDVNMMNHHIDQLNELYNFLYDTTDFILIQKYNKQIISLKRMMKVIKPNWLKR